MLDVEKIVYKFYSITLYISVPLNRRLNPEFLLENNVVPEDWTVDLESSQDFGIIQRFKFQEGLLVQAHPDRLYFQWDIITDEMIRSQIALCNAIIEALLTLPSFVVVDTSVIQLHGYTMMPENSLGITNLGEPLEDLHPVISFRADYDLEIRDVQFDIGEATMGPGEFINSLQFTYSTKYYFSEDVSGQASWESIVVYHEDWIKECSYLVDAFYSNHIK